MATLLISFVLISLVILLLSINLLFGRPPIESGCSGLVCKMDCQEACPHKNSRN